MAEHKVDPRLAFAEYLGVDYDTAKALIREAMATPWGECAKDLQVGLQVLGLSSIGNQRMEAILGGGGAVALYCSTCHAHGQSHLLRIQMFGNQFVVLPVVAV